MDSLLAYVKVGRDLEQWAYKEGLTPAQAFVILGVRTHIWSYDPPPDCGRAALAAQHYAAF